jgi:tetratricopeptide (TPR) repeat protein
VTKSRLPETPEEPSKTQRTASAAESIAPPGRLRWTARAADAVLILLMLGLTFLLGVFPLKDTDIYWHLKTGDLIRQTGHVPRTDIFTFTRGASSTSEAAPWIDLHWLYQVGVSWLFEHGGVVALNLAKCVVTTLAMLVLLTARRREWPVWVMVLAWLPALVALGGRMYVRPETLTLLYLSIFLAVIMRWDRYPALAWLLPVVQVFWVNSQGLFVLGPIVLAFGLIDVFISMAMESVGGETRFLNRTKWLRTVLGAGVATGLACLINPYGLHGALYPLELAGTMRNPIFSQNIAELMSIPDLMKSSGLWNRLLQLHLAIMALGALSFVVPLSWRFVTWVADRRGFGRTTEPIEAAPRTEPTAEKAKKPARSRKPKPAVTNRAPAPLSPVDQTPGWRLSPFRLLLYIAFSLLSLQATRNSHQFAAVVGTVTAWNLGEWAWSVRKRRMLTGDAPTRRAVLSPRLLSIGLVSLVLVWVATGQYYKFNGEGRTIGLGEEPLWFPHEAVRFAGQAGMPEKFLAFHIGHAALFEYYHGPDRKVYTDPRLEVIGADLFTRYATLEKRIKKNEPGWEDALDTMGRPVIVADHELNADIGVTLLASPHWRCVWFDAIAAVFVHDSYASVVKEHAVDFGGRHFRADSSTQSQTQSVAELTALARAYRRYVTGLAGVGMNGLARPMVWLGVDETRHMLHSDPASLEGWKNSGLINFFRELPREISARFRAPFNPPLDLSMMRATFALRRALELAPHDFLTLVTLQLSYDSRQMYEAFLPLLDRIDEARPINRLQINQQADTKTSRAKYSKAMGPAPLNEWRNLSDLDRVVSANLASGRAASAAELLEQAYPPESAPWEVLEKIVTLRLHLGEPARARGLLQKATTVSEPALREARIATTYLIEGDFDAARRHYRAALDAKPGLFEAHYCLAVLEQDAGLADAAYEQARKAVASADNDVGRSAARQIATSVSRFTQGRTVVAAGPTSMSASRARDPAP